MREQKRVRRQRSGATRLGTERLESRAMLAMQEFLVNGGADAPAVNGEIPGWREVRGSSWTSGQAVAPQAGSGHFFAGREASAELSQAVNVSSAATEIDAGQQRMAFSGYIRCWDQNPVDTSRIILEYRNSSGSLLGSFDTGNRSSRTAWSQISQSATLPAGTRSITVRLLAERNKGNDNDGYFDSLSLKLDRPEQTVTAKVENRVLIIEGDSTANDAQVNRVDGQIKVTIRSIRTGMLPVFTTIERSFDAAGISSIRFNGRGNNDRFVNNVTLPATAYGGPGNDYLKGTRAVDTFFGEEGDDTLVGYGGKDALDGGMGTDSGNAAAGSQLPGCESVQLTGLPSGSPQAKNKCGPNSAWRVMNSLGHSASLQQVTDAVSEQSIVARWNLGSIGSSLVRAMNAVRNPAIGPEFSLKTKSSIDAIATALQAGRPAVAMIRVTGTETYLGYELPALHWIAVTGVNRGSQTITYKDTDGYDYSMSFDSFNSKFNWDAGILPNNLFQSLGIVKGTIIV